MRASTPGSGIDIRVSERAYTYDEQSAARSIRMRTIQGCHRHRTHYEGFRDGEATDSESMPVYIAPG